MNISEAIAQINAATKKMFGDGTAIMAARCPAFGHADVCLIVHGDNHAIVADGIKSAHKDARVELLHGTSFHDGSAYSYSTVTLPALAA